MVDLSASALCRVTSAQSREPRDRFHCVACGHADHAGLNAAANILALGHLRGEVAELSGP